MTGEELRAARRTLGMAWGVERPLSLMEMAWVLRLAGKDPGASLRDYEQGKGVISGPMSLAVELLLAGARPAELEAMLEEIRP